MQLPSKLVQEEMVDNMKCFALEKDENVPESRRLVFADNAAMKEFKTIVTIMTNLKMYIERICRERERIEPLITTYLKKITDTDTILFKDTSLHAEYRIMPIIAKLERQEYLKSLTLHNCGIGDYYFTDLLDMFTERLHTIEHLDVSHNDLTFHSMKKFASYLANISVSGELQSVCLDKNDLADNGVKELMDGLIERFN